MIIPCPFHTTCIDPANPLANTSAELPDPDFFIGYNSWYAGDPPLDSIWSSTGCISQCTSVVSQLDADTCAANQQLTCSVTDGGGDGGINDGPGWINPGTGNPYIPQFNDPETCVVLCPDGLPFAYTQPGLTVLGLNRSQADNVAFAIACAKAKTHRLCLSALSQTEVCVGTNFTGTITATGGTVDQLRTIWTNPGGGLPPGISMSFSVGGGTLTLSGKATTAGSYSFVIMALTPSGDFMSKTFTICVVDITPNSLPNATAGTAYSQTLAATCGAPPLNYQVTSGALPNGLTLNQSTGIIGGTPTVVGSFSFTVTAQTSAS